MPPPAPLPGSDPAAEAVLREGLEELALEADLAPRLAGLCVLLDAWSQRMSLTAHRGAEAIARRLVLDALALERQLPDAATIVDLGSGAGFPGLPIALARPDARVRLVEARERRHHFQRAAVRELGLRNVEPLLGRAEGLEPRPHALALAQAMGAPDQVVRWLLPWVEPGGLLAIPGGERPPSPGSIDGVEAVRVVAYRVPLGGPARTLWLASRAA